MMKTVRALDANECGKSRLLTVLVCLVIIFGVLEYTHLREPLPQITLVYQPQGAFDNGQKNGKTEDSDALILDENELPLVDEEVPSFDDKTEAKNTDNSQALAEFLAYLKEVKHRNEPELVKTLVLDKIIQNVEVKKTKPLPKAVFESGKIEVYDSEKGVVDVIDSKEVTAVRQNEDKTDKQKNGQAMIMQKINDETDIESEIRAIRHEVEDATQAINEQIEAEELAEMANVEAVRKQVDADLLEMTSKGDEAPVVLIPGMQNDF